MGLSAFLIVRDEAHDLPACLRSLQGLADDLVVVDSGSTDGTLEVARGAGARVFERTFKGFGPQKQFALEQTTEPWALSIDADERVTPALAAEIRAAVGADAADGYEIRREVYFLGRRMRYGGLGDDRVLRLFRRAKGRFTEAAVHERVVVDGRVGRLAGALEHHTYATVREYVDKANLYTDLASRERFARGVRFRPWDHLRPPVEFVLRYLVRGGFLDGEEGFLWAALSSHTTWLRSLKLRDLERGARRSGPASEV
jgi:glycosyltransferase involved in cell wall biosynthesis